VTRKGPPKHNRRRNPRTARRSRTKNLALAIFFFILGVIGVLLPIVPQVPFFIMSVLFLSLVFPRVRKALRSFLHKHPRIAHVYKRWRDKARKKRQALIQKEREFFGGR
jgi:uncharacterized protein